MSNIATTSKGMKVEIDLSNDEFEALWATFFGINSTIPASEEERNKLQKGYLKIFAALDKEAKVYFRDEYESGCKELSDAIRQLRNKNAN